MAGDGADAPGSGSRGRGATWPSACSVQPSSVRRRRLRSVKRPCSSSSVRISRAGSSASGRARSTANSVTSSAGASGWRSAPAASAISSIAAAGSTGSPARRWSASQGSSAVSRWRVQRPGSGPWRRPSSLWSARGAVTGVASGVGVNQMGRRSKGVCGRPRRSAGPAKAPPPRGSAPRVKARSAMAGKGSPGASSRRERVASTAASEPASRSPSRR